MLVWGLLVETANSKDAMIYARVVDFYRGMIMQNFFRTSYIDDVVVSNSCLLEHSVQRESL